VKRTNAPKTFIEFGFHPIEFNCASFVQNRDWQGLLIDCSARQVSDARAILPKRIEIVQAFLTLDNLDFIKSRFAELGVLSIDVDGNDYWFLEKLIDVKPSVICVEYNASLGLEPITVPYDHVVPPNAATRNRAGQVPWSPIRLSGRSKLPDRPLAACSRKRPTLTSFHPTPPGSPSLLQVSINSEEVQVDPLRPPEILASSNVLTRITGGKLSQQEIEEVQMLPHEDRT